MKKTAIPRSQPVAASAATHAAPQADQRPATAQQVHLQQAIAASPRQVAQRQQALAAAPAPNRTGLPDALKAGVEHLSGHALDDVRVHYNSARPAALHAHAYAQGTDIHLAPGQHQHLPHEAWHVAQQKQGRVRPTTQLKGISLNDDSALEREADQMGRQAAQLRSAAPGSVAGPPRTAALGSPVMQRKVFLLNADQNIYQDTKNTLQLSYIGTMGNQADKQPLFIAYQDFINLQGQGLDRWEGTVRDKHATPLGKKYRPEHYLPGSKPYEEEYTTFFKQYTAEEFASPEKKDEFFNAHAFYTENERGELQEVDTTSLASRMILQARLEVAYRDGPLYRNVGGGSRAPKASGTLVIYQDPTKHPQAGITKSSLSQALGIDETNAKHEANYGGVQEHVVTTPQELNDLHAQAAGQEGHLVDERRHGFFYKSDVTLLRSKSALFTAAGQNYDEDFGGILANSPAYTTLLNSFRSLAPPQDRGWRPGTELSSQNREDGQAKAMHKWNALGAAAFANKFLGTTYPLTQNWEWLHVQGAQIGGETQGGNLVAGTFAANSAMIPFETQIAKWAQRGAQQMHVRFLTSGASPGFANRITIEVIADGHPDLHTIEAEAPLRVDFAPLTTTVIDKFTGRLLAKQREFLLQQKTILPHELEQLKEKTERRKAAEAMVEDTTMAEAMIVEGD